MSAAAVVMVLLGIFVFFMDVCFAVMERHVRLGWHGIRSLSDSLVLVVVDPKAERLWAVHARSGKAPVFGWPYLNAGFRIRQEMRGNIPVSKTGFLSARNPVGV
jgi:hypothetical protein